MIPTARKKKLLRFAFPIAVGMLLLLLSQIGLGFAAGNDNLPAREPRRLSSELLQQFVNEFEQQRHFYHVPGAAVAIVHNNEVILARGFGVRKLGESTPITAETLFSVGSLSKSMTAMMVGSLVDDGYFNWSTPINQLNPQFRLANDAATYKITLRDTFSHTSGLPDLEIVTAHSGLLPREIFQYLHGVTPDAPAGSSYLYSNTVFTVGSYSAVVAAEREVDENLGHEYRELVEERLFNPMGMKNSGLSSNFIRASANHATPYISRINGDIAQTGLTPIQAQFSEIGSLVPAGGIRSSAMDMSRYLLTLLNRGVSPDGHQVISNTNLQELFKPHIKLPSGPLFDSVSYGLGWMNTSYQGVPVLTHSGQIGGFSSTIALVPQANLGIVVLSNIDNAGLPFNQSIQYRLVEMLYDLQPRITTFTRKLYLEQAKQLSEFYQLLKPINTTVVGPFIGSYQLWGDPYQLQIRDKRLWLLRGGADLTELLRGPDNRYYGVSGSHIGLFIDLITGRDGHLAIRLNGKDKLYKSVTL